MLTELLLLPLVPPLVPVSLLLEPLVPVSLLLEPLVPVSLSLEPLVPVSLLLDLAAKAGEFKAPAVTRIIAVRTTMIANVVVFIFITPR